MNSEILNAVIEYFKSHLKEYIDDVFYYEDAFLRVTEDKEHIYVEYAESEYEVENNMFDDGDCYMKSLGQDTIIQYISEEYNIA